jgi:hypothetical protein
VSHTDPLDKVREHQVKEEDRVAGFLIVEFCISPCPYPFVLDIKISKKTDDENVDYGQGRREG